MSKHFCRFFYIASESNNYFFISSGRRIVFRFFFSVNSSVKENILYVYKKNYVAWILLASALETLEQLAALKCLATLLFIFLFGNVLFRHSIDLGSRSRVAVGSSAALSAILLFSDLPQIDTALPQIETALTQI